MRQVNERTMKQTESKLQSACVKWFRYQYPEYKKLFFHPANGAKRDKITASILKGQGVEPGVSDLVLLVPNKDFIFFCIELKCNNNRQTPPQFEFERDVYKVGGKYSLVRSFDEFRAEAAAYIENGAKTISKT